MANKRILLVDYDPKSLSYTRELLQTAGFDVAVCSDGLSAIDQFKSVNPDLVLLSAMLPKMHGFEVCSTIRKMPGGDKTPVVIITDVYKGKRYRLDALTKYGATEYIEKPIEDANLLSILKGLVKENGTSPAAAPAEEVESKTVRFNRDDIMKMAGESKAAQEKAAPPPKKVRRDDDIERKLEESLAGLSLDLGRGTLSKMKPKPKAPDPAKPRPEPPAAFRPPAPQQTAVPPAPAPPVASPVEKTAEKLEVPAAFRPSASATPAPPAPPKTPAPPAEPPKPSVPVAAVEPPKAAQPVPPAEPPKAAQTAPPVEPAKVTTSKDDADGMFTSEDLFTDVIASVERELESEKIITKSGVKEQKTNPVPAAELEDSKAAAKSTFESELEKKISNTLSGILKEKEKEKAKQEAPKVPPAQPEPDSTPATIQLTREKVEESLAAVAGPGGINFGQYLLLSKIATGGMAELFKAKRKGVEGFEKILAIKRILPHMSDNEEFITMFIDEAKLAAQLTHHNICQIFDLGKIENSYYIAMEFVDGKDLRAVLKSARTKSRQVPVELAILITSKILSALDYAHRKKDTTGQPLNLVHRDVSPQNILISYEGDVKLVDFGIAKAATKMHVTQHGALKGKLLYMSPEQAWGKAVDRRSDIFSAGAVLYEMLTGRPLFFDESDTEVTILEKVREAHVTPIRQLLPAVPAELEKIISKALHKDPEMRYNMASDMQKDLDNLFYNEGYNATGASLANFARSLFPEELTGHESAKDTIMLDKQSAKALKSSLAAKPAEPPAKATSSKPEPPPRVSTKKTASKTSEPKIIPTPVEPKKSETPAPVPAAKPPETTAKKDEVAAGGFREISMPEIIPPQPAKSNASKFIFGGIALAAVFGIVAFLFFKPQNPSQTAKQTPAPVQQKNQQQSNAPVTTTSTDPNAPAQQTPPATSDPQQEAAQKQKEELLKKIEEEQKKVDALKAEEQKKLDQQKLEEQKKLDTQRKAEEEKKAEEARLAQEAEAARMKQEEEARLEEERKAAELARQQEEQRQKEADALAQQQAAAQTPPETAVPEQPQVQEGDLVELTPDVVKPVVTNKVDPAYPPVARQKKVEGTVILQALVSEAGEVSDVKVLRPAGGSSGLNESAVAAVKKWKFRPAVKAGKKVKVWVTYPIVFKLQ